VRPKGNLIIETPDGLVKREAAFYPMMGGVLDGHLSFTPMEKMDYFPPIGDPCWYPNNANRFRPIELPEDMTPYWQHKYLTTDINDIAPLVSDIRVNNDDLIPYIPDICPWTPFTIVSQKARAVLEGIDPDGSYFFPVKIYSLAGSLIERPFFGWVVRNRLFYRNNTLGRPVLGAPFPGPFCDPGMVYEMTNVPGVNNYLKQFSFWGLGMGFLGVCFGREAFEILRSERLTGLVENTEEKYAADRKTYESIGHIG